MTLFYAPALRDFIIVVDRIPKRSILLETYMSKLTAEEVRHEIAGLHGWTVDTMLRKTFQFADFQAAIAWVVRVAFLAEAQAHHPDLDIRYNRVQVALETHDVGGLSAKDVALARAIEAIEGSAG